MFELASRLKVRFNYRGLCTVEDLWDLSLPKLNEIFVELKAQQNAQQAESLMSKKSKDDELLDLKIELVKHVFEVKSAERAAGKLAMEKATFKQKLLGIKAEKQDAALKELSPEDIDKMLAEMEVV